MDSPHKRLPECLFHLRLTPLCVTLDVGTASIIVVRDNLPLDKLLLSLVLVLEKTKLHGFEMLLGQRNPMVELWGVPNLRGRRMDVPRASVFRPLLAVPWIDTLRHRSQSDELLT